MHDVIVIGGGPAGLWLAYRLACDGFDTVVLDDRSSIGDRKICTGIVSPETFDRFQLPRDSILNDIQKMRFFSPSGSELQYVHPSVLAHVVDRTAFDKSISQIAENEGVKIWNGKRVNKVTQHKNCVEVEIAPARATRRGFASSRSVTFSATGSGEGQFLSARIAVIATGVNSRLNKPLGLGAPTAFLNAAQTHLKVKNLESTHCYTGRSLAPGGFGWLVPLDGQRARLGLMTEGNVTYYFKNLLEKTAAHLDTPVNEIEVNVKPIAQGFNGKSYGHRVIAVGEAAGQIKTTTGGGIYYGLLCAGLAADVLQDSLRRNCCDKGFLSRYEDKWKEEINQELRLGHLFRKAVTRLPDRQLEKLFSLARTNGILPLIRMTVKFDWHAETLCSLAQYATIQKILEIDSNQC